MNAYRLNTTFRPLSRRLASSRSLCLASSAPRAAGWSAGPAPPRLPKEDQEVFEKLQKQSTGAFSTPRSEESQPDDSARDEASTREAMLETMRARIRAKGEGDELHPDVRRGAQPEFEGDTNPKTGEVGGPKNDPLRWGSGEQKGDWSFNGRVTDF